MQDDFNHGMGIPDDELPGGSAEPEPGDPAHHGAEPEMEGEGAAAPGRPSGGARARKSSSGARKSGGARKAGGKKKSARKAAKKGGKKKKAARKSARKGGAKRKAGRKK